MNVNRPSSNTNERSENKCKILFSNLPIGLMMLNSESELVDANSYIFKYFNLSKEEVSGKKFGNLFRCKNAVETGSLCGTGEACKKCELSNGLAAVIDNGVELAEVEWKHEFMLGGRISVKWFTINATRLVEDEEVSVLVSFTDITERKKVEKDLIDLGVTDELTGLYNRRFIMKELEKCLNDCDETHPISLALIDIDGFKGINDAYGHSAGDRSLVSLSDTFRESTRDTDYVGRFGGDEFLLLLNNTQLGAAKIVIERISNKYKERLSQKKMQPLTFSTGLIEIRRGNRCFDGTQKIFDRVDKLLYKAKEEGRNKIATE